MSALACKQDYFRESKWTFLLVTWPLSQGTMAHHTLCYTKGNNVVDCLDLFWAAEVCHNLHMNGPIRWIQVDSLLDKPILLTKVKLQEALRSLDSFFDKRSFHLKASFYFFLAKWGCSAISFKCIKGMSVVFFLFLYASATTDLKRRKKNKKWDVTLVTRQESGMKALIWLFLWREKYFLFTIYSKL